MRKRIWLAVAIGLVSSGVAISARERQSSVDGVESFERTNLAGQIYRELEAEAAKDPSFDIDRLALWSKNWLAAEIDLHANPEQRVAACQDHLNRTEKLALLAARQVQPGDDRTLEGKVAHFYVLEARARFEQARLELSQPERERRRMQLLRDGQ